MDDLEPSFRGLSESFEQGYAGTQERLVKPEVPAADGLKRSVNTQFVCHKPVMPSFHGICRRTVLGIGVFRGDNTIQDAGDHFGRIVFELNYEIRQHAVQAPAAWIVTSGTGNPEPFRLPALIPDDPAAVVAVAEAALLTGWANIISALN